MKPAERRVRERLLCGMAGVFVRKNDGLAACVLSANTALFSALLFL
jgi:hypothetical protein